jgi:hypothetical protein
LELNNEKIREPIEIIVQAISSSGVHMLSRLILNDQGEEWVKSYFNIHS